VSSNQANAAPAGAQMKPNITATELAPLVVGFSFIDKLVELRSHERLSIWLIRILKCFLRFLNVFAPSE
jgi:hypothetical protein